MPEKQDILADIARHFEAVAVHIERAIEALANDDSGTVELAALHRARDVAHCGANIAHNAATGVRRAFD